MAELTFDVQDLSNIPNAVLVKMGGAIDASTVVNFQSTLENLQLKGVKRFILDMEGIRYVNSTGLGSLVRLADQLESDGGGFALVKIHPKVKVVFDMLGLNAFFKIFPNQAAAEDGFRAGVKPEEMAGKGPAKPAAPPQKPAGQTRQVANPLAQQAPPAGLQPRAIQCQNCQVTLRIQQPGNFKCSRCNTLFTVQPDGNVQFHIQQKQAQPQMQAPAPNMPPPPQRPPVPPLQMNLACRDDIKQALMAFLSVLAQQASFPPERVQALSHSINEIVSHITNDAYGNNSQATYSVLIAPVGQEINIKFADKGRPLTNPALFQYSRQVMRLFDLKPHPQGGNILTLKMTVM